MKYMNRKTQFLERREPEVDTNNVPIVNEGSALSDIADENHGTV